MEQPEYMTPVSKDTDAYNAFYSTSVAASKLRSMVISGGMGTGKTQRKTALAMFREQFDLLYTLTMDNKDINKEVVKEVGQKLRVLVNPTDDAILDFCDTFYKYKSELVNAEVL